MPMHEWNLPRESELARLDKLHLPIAGLLRQWDDGGDRDAALCARLREAFGQLFHQEDALIHRCGLESAAADGHLAEHQQLLEKIDTALSEPGDAAHDALRGALRHWRRRHRDSHDLLLRYAASSLEHEQQRQREAHQREWRCAHAINRLLAAPGELSTALQQIAELLPAGLGWPPACGIHLLFRQWHVCSEAYDADRTRLHIALLVDGQVAGDLELSLAGDETDSTFLATESERLYRLAQCLEQALEQRERRQQADRQNAEFRIAMENAADATIVTDTRGRLSYANNAACNLLGYTREHMLRLNLTDLSPPEEMPRHLREFQALQHNGFLRGEFRLRRQDGRSLIMELNGVPLPEQRYLISGRDITASTLAENALRESEDRFRTIVEATGDGILVSEKSSGRFIFANQAMCQMLGYTSGQLTGLSMPHIHPDSELPDIRKTMRQMNEGRLAIASEIPVKRRDGSLFYADVKSSPIRFGQTPCLMAVFRDVSERREAELLLKRHLDIQSLLGTLSTQLANDPIETLWDRLPDMLGRVGSMLHADRGCLIRLDRLKRSSLLTHLWQKTGEDGLPLPNTLNIPTSGMDWLCGELERQGFLTVDADTSLPAEGGTLKALMRVNGSRSLLIAPLRQQQEISQLIIMDCQSDRHWLWIESRMLQSVAEMLAGSIEQYYRTLELTESRRRLLEAQRIARVGSWEWDILHDSMHWSEEVYSIAGLHAEQIDSSYDNFLGLIHPQDSKLVRQAINRSLERLTPLELEHRIIRPDGSERVVCQQAIVRVSDNGRALRMTGTLQDITEAKQKELLLRQSATVYENTLEGVMITDRDLSILDVNPAFSQITGYSRQEIIGKNPRVLQSGKHDHHFYQQIHESIRVTGHWQGEIWNRRKNGDIYPEWLTISAVYDDQRVVTNYVGVFSDISQIKKSESDLEKLAHFDSLTGLPNRLLFLSRLDHAIENAKRSGAGVAILFIDLDNFKQVNDTLGHSTGDRLLLEVATRLKTCVRKSDTVARIGGDEFLVLLENQSSDNPAIDIAAKLVAACGKPFLLDGHEMMVTASIGISLFPRDGLDAETLMRNADIAMYQSKAEGKSCFHFYTEELTRHAMLRVKMEQELRTALRRKQLHLALQPKYRLTDGKLSGAEVLLRWHHPDLGRVPPDVFIPLAEETGLIIPIGAWTLRQTCLLIRKWLDMGLTPGMISINIAGPQIRRAPLQETLQHALNEFRLSPEQLDLEVTESFVMHRPDESLKVLRNLRELGVNLSIDDFGTGYSSLAYLKQLPIQTLKIDKSFVRGLPHNENDVGICRAIISLARTMHMQLVAEGIETEEQLRFLVEEGCEFGQGYHFAKPMSVEDFEALLQSSRISERLQSISR